MIKGQLRLLTLLLFLFLLPHWLGALTVKLASPLPEGTEWDNSLKQMAEEWRQITGGRVRVIIYPGGIAGAEADMVRKMRIGQIDAGVFSAFGLKMMVPETFILTLPSLIKNDDELDYVFDTFLPGFDDRFREEGFEMLAWSNSGWAKIFCREPIRSPENLFHVSLAVDNTETETSAAYKALGFNVVGIGLNEIMIGLQSGLVDAVTVPPVLAGAYQWFALVPYMTDFNITPILGGLVISERTWQRIPVEFHAELKASMEKVAVKFYEEARSLNTEALKVMKDYGLKEIELNDDEIAAFTRVMENGHLLMVGEGKAVPAELYEELRSKLEAFRKR
ncbi:MAG: TRAP transporter substrate-binding protein DctP [Spirochaetaceae bacterium]|nr:TRAP transporter substrate-binding protein DctP [Spirochaetaceae bacterium]